MRKRGREGKEEKWRRLGAKREIKLPHPQSLSGQHSMARAIKEQWSLEAPDLWDYIEITKTYGASQLPCFSLRTPETGLVPQPQLVSGC